MSLPSFIYTPRVKTGNETEIYYNFGVGRVKKRLYNGGEKVVSSCGGSSSCPAGSFDATVLQSVLGTDQAAFGGIAENSPLYTAVEGEQAPVTDGVNADLVCLPDPANDVLVCFDRAFTAEMGQQFRAIARKYAVTDHYVRQRGENQLSITDVFVANKKGLSAIKGRRCTIIVKVYPDGGGALQELIYFSNVLLNMPLIAWGNDSNQEMEISATGMFDFCAVFSADPS